MSVSKYVPLRIAKERLGMSGNTLRKYAEGGKIDFIKNEAGQRLFDVDGYIGKQQSVVDEIMLLVEGLSDAERKELKKRLCQK